MIQYSCFLIQSKSIKMTVDFTSNKMRMRRKKRHNCKLQGCACVSYFVS